MNKWINLIIGICWLLITVLAIVKQGVNLVASVIAFLSLSSLFLSTFYQQFKYKVQHDKLQNKRAEILKLMDEKIKQLERGK